MILTLFLSGIITGILSTFFGIGGGMLVVPILYSIFPNVDHSLIISSSLGMILINSIINTYFFRRNKLIANYKLFLPISLFMIIGTVGSAYASQFLSIKMIKWIFIIVLILIMIKMIFFKVKKTNQENC